MWNQGIHARASVACADCHMPFQRVGAQKVSDHQVRSPLLNVDAACRTCHPVAAGELRARAERIQENTFRLRNQAMDAITALIADLKVARAAGRDSSALAPAQSLHRRAQFYLDFIEAENSMGFHAPQEAARILGEAIDYARQGQIAIRDPSFTPKLPPPAGN
jgi:nitrite reductase (cytochrome c-552)